MTSSRTSSMRRGRTWLSRGANGASATGAPATSAPVDHAFRASWGRTARKPRSGNRGRRGRIGPRGSLRSDERDELGRPRANWAGRQTRRAGEPACHRGMPSPGAVDWGSSQVFAPEAERLRHKRGPVPGAAAAPSAGTSWIATSAAALSARERAAGRWEEAVPSHASTPGVVTLPGRRSVVCWKCEERG